MREIRVILNATLLLQAGVNAEIVSEHLGHHSVAFTLETYANLMPGMKSEAVRRLSALVDDPAGAPDLSTTPRRTGCEHVVSIATLTAADRRPAKMRKTPGPAR